MAADYLMYVGLRDAIWAGAWYTGICNDEEMVGTGRETDDAWMANDGGSCPLYEYIVP